MDRRSALIGAAAAGAAAFAAKYAGGPSLLTVAGGGAGGGDGGITPRGVAAPPPVTLGDVPPFGRVTLRSAPLGGGGFVTGIDISTDGGRLVCRTDVCNAYVRDRDAHAWTPLFSAATMDKRDLDPLPDLADKADAVGVAAIRIAPSNRDVIYASYRGYVWRSADGGRTIRRTALAQRRMFSNSGVQRLYNRAIDVHPRDANQLLVGTWGDGVWHSGDGGARWRRIAVPEAKPDAQGLPGLNLVLFDEAKPDAVYVFVAGVGLFGSIKGAAGPFALMPGGPTHCCSLVSGHDGAVCLAEPTPAHPGRFWRYDPGKGWTSASTPQQLSCIAADPRTPGRLFGYSDYGAPQLSTDAGGTWRVIDNSIVADGSEVAWSAGVVTLFPAQVVIDPSARDTAWIAHGIGVSRASPITGAMKVRDRSAGIEELCAVAALSVPGGKTFLTSWDKPIWRLDDEVAYNNRFMFPQGPGSRYNATIVTHGFYLDHAGDDPSLLVAVVNSGGAHGAIYGPGYSPDGGENWLTFDGAPPRGWGVGGCIAASTRDNFVYLPSNNGVGAFTLDGGKRWDSIRLDGVTETSQFANAYYVYRKNITADKSHKGVFALVYTVIQPTGDTYGNPLGGLWVTRDGGVTWRQMLKGVIGTGNDHSQLSMPPGQDPRQYWQCQLDYVPGHASELLYTPHADYGDDRLWWSRDDGATWTEPCNSARAVRAFGFGKAAPGQTRPAVYFQGTVRGRKGVFASFDWFKTDPQLLYPAPATLLSDIVAISGDPNRFGRCYIGLNAGGWQILDVGAGNDDAGARR